MMAASSGLLRYHPANSFLHRADALSKSLWVILVSLGVYLVTPPLLGLVILLLLFVCTIWLAQMPLGTILRSANLIFALGSLLFIFHSVIQPGMPLLRLGPLTVSDCGVGIGLHYFFTLSSVVVVSLVFTWTTDIRDLMAGLVRAGFPFQLAFAIFLMFRFMPLMRQELETVNAAHAIRGHAAKSGLRHRFYLWQRYMFTVLVNGLRKAEQSSIATECRAFGAVAKRTELREHQWSLGGLLFLGIWVAVFLGFIVAQRSFPICSVRSVII
jgi:energy-coupling factor transport system permease protein